MGVIENKNIKKDWEKNMLEQTGKLYTIFDDEQIKNINLIINQINCER